MVIAKSFYWCLYSIAPSLLPLQVQSTNDHKVINLPTVTKKLYMKCFIEYGRD